MSPELRAKLAHSAIDSERSLNAEIVWRLERSFDPDPSVQLAVVFKAIASLSESDRRKVGELLTSVGSILAKKHPTR